MKTDSNAATKALHQHPIAAAVYFQKALSGISWFEDNTHLGKLTSLLMLRQKEVLIRMHILRWRPLVIEIIDMGQPMTR
ncbi:hypothetical protein AQUCO_04200123v1 [Aquilegia coerulea]|uniref:Uncharacterized protein n=1 Tax=Aquilegia coerulea TaxID=218851 RepID=A0A2G5CPD4_AQUCA|nr:hypothetical protein AQUCO_04200123v1 [Aquilegia coerulea]